MRISCGHCKNTHPTVGDVRACAAAQQFQTAPKFTYSERRPGDMPPVRPTNAPGGGSYARAREAREATQVSTKKRADEGMYRKAGTIYKVQKAVHGSKLNYAKRLVQVLANDPKTGKPKFRFEYAPGFVFELRSEHMLSLEQAKEFGALYGTCCVCGRTLTRESSIEAGIGPVCAQKF